MPASSISADVRGTLATALSGVAGNVYSYVPEAIIPPAVVIVPSSPYMEINLIGKSSSNYFSTTRSRLPLPTIQIRDHSTILKN